MRTSMLAGALFVAVTLSTSAGLASQPDDGTGMPSVEEVSQKVTGLNPVDTAARQAAAFTELEHILASLPRDPQSSRAVSNLARAYAKARFQARGLINTREGAALVNSYSRDETFRRGLLGLISGRARRVLDARTRNAEAMQERAAEAAEKAKAEAEAKAAAEEAAKKVVVDLTGLWTGVYECSAGVTRPELMQISLHGRSLRATKVAADDCGAAKTVLWEGELSEDALTVGDLPMSVEVKVAQRRTKRRKATTSSETLTIVSSDDLQITGLKFDIIRGDVRKEAMALLSRRGSASAANPPQVGGSLDLEQYQRDLAEHAERERRRTEHRQDEIEKANNPNYTPSCGSDCYGSRPGEN